LLQLSSISGDKEKPALCSLFLFYPALTGGGTPTDGSFTLGLCFTICFESIKGSLSTKKMKNDCAILISS
jgi:hypothetical protein